MFQRLFITLTVFCTFTVFINANFAQTSSGFFQTPVLKEMFDETHFTEWVDGTEQLLNTKTGTAWVLTSQTTLPGYNGLEFGKSKVPGTRYLRVALKSPVPVGTLLVQGTGIPGVLKSNISNAGDVSDDKQWITGVRIQNRMINETENDLERKHFTVWLFPPGTKTTAIRFQHTSQAADKSYAGWLGGILVLSERLVNLAPYAQAFATGQSQYANRVNDETNNEMRIVWNNGDEGSEFVVSPEHPEYVSLIWDKPVKLQGICTLWTGFLNADAEVYVGHESQHPNESTQASDWKTVVSKTKLHDGYIPHLAPNWFDFGNTVTTRAVRLRITAPLDETRVHGHLKGKIKEGKRVWLGELMCFAPLEEKAEPTAILPKPHEENQPPIPIRFKMPEDGIVTLVIEKEDGTRINNLVSETPFPKGENVVYWDGSDDWLRDNEAASHGVYHIPKRLVESGTYQVRGLYRQPLSLRYEFSIYNEGTPPWSTADNTGGWLTNHTPPGCTLWVPAEQSPTGSPLVYLGSYVAEGGHGLAWFDVQPDKEHGIAVTKKGGFGWVGGFWTGAQFLARDTGEKRNASHLSYVASVWSVVYNYKQDANKDLEVRISALKTQGTPSSVKYTFKPIADKPMAGNDWKPYFTGFSVHNGVAVLSMGLLNQLIFIDTENGNVLETVKWINPGASAFDSDGNFYLLSGQSLYRWNKNIRPKNNETPKAFLSGLDEPKALTFDTAGHFYIAEQGNSHFVRIFDKNGQQLRTIGKKGIPQSGFYDELRMNHPSGLTIDNGNRLWVTENDFQPKRVSVWSLDGQLIRAFYGPAEYGGGGQLDSADPTRFFYYGMEFKLDWKNGTYKLVRVYSRKTENPALAPDGHHSEKLPETALYPQWTKTSEGSRYFTNCYNCNPTVGTPLSAIWYDNPKTGVAQIVAACGSVHQWSVFKQPEFRSKIPKGIDLDKARHQNLCRFIWSDLNEDGLIQPDETQFEIGESGGITAGVSEGRLHFIASRVSNEKQNGNNIEMQSVLYRATSMKGHVPLFDFASKQILVSNVEPPRSSGGDQVLYNQENDRCILTLGVKPFARESVTGTKNGNVIWTYPNPWPGLHPSHEAPTPHQPGQLIGVTRLLGDFVKVNYPNSIFAVNANMGNIYLLTDDGLFVATLFHDSRTAPTWSMPISQRNMDVGGLTLHDENFWPSITQTKDGKIFLVDGGRSALVRVDGLDTIRQLPTITFSLTKDDLEKANVWLIDAERSRQQNRGQALLRILIRKETVTVDGSLSDWEGADWGIIDRSGVAANFNSNSKPYDITAAACISKDRLVVAYRTNVKDILKNSGEMLQAPFKTGGCLDLMIGADSKADPNRRNPVQGDSRLLVTLIKGKPYAVLYRAVVPGTNEPVPFSSPWRTITLDRVDDISDQIEFAMGGNGIFELAVPLKLLNLEAVSGSKIKADIGVLRGNGFSTLARVYWSNKATAITADVPSEAQLTPFLWGNWLFE
ncbi:MAG: hypothetical protein LBQ50_03030 [Planctomycetaceae bacterium]|jgi:hypothetical protein|nr:hypothetical protein [Planctomycetaceae bacterium]